MITSNFTPSETFKPMISCCLQFFFLNRLFVLLLWQLAYTYIYVYIYIYIYIYIYMYKYSDPVRGTVWPRGWVEV